jgi:hypothetical protein
MAADADDPERLVLSLVISFRLCSGKYGAVGYFDAYFDSQPSTMNCSPPLSKPAPAQSAI